MVTDSYHVFRYKRSIVKFFTDVHALGPAIIAKVRVLMAMRKVPAVGMFLLRG